MKFNIGVSIVGKNKKVGSKYCAVVVAHPNLFRTVFFNGKELTKALYDKLEHAYVVQLKPYDIFENDDGYMIITALNTVKEFWKHNIYVSEPKEVVEHIKNNMPKNLRKIDLGINNWNFGDSSRVTKVAELLAKRYEDNEIEYLRDVYGYKDDESFVKENEGNPYIRK